MAEAEIRQKQPKGQEKISAVMYGTIYSEQMLEGFGIHGENGNFLRVIFEEVYGFPDSTYFGGGYEARTILEIKSGAYGVKSPLWTTTGELYELREHLRRCNEALAGSTTYLSYEGNLEFVATYDTMGHVTIKGRFADGQTFDNVLHFEFATDQTFIRATLTQLDQLVHKYGAKNGTG